MGIDAEMFIKTRQKLSNKSVRSLSVDLCEAFGSDKFFLQRKEDKHALSISSSINQDSNEVPEIIPNNGETFIEISLWTRYYGDNYERGDVCLILNVANWFKNRLPDCEVWYGGDSSGVEFEQLTEEKINEIWNHFCLVGHKPYERGFGDDNSSLNNDGCSNPKCDFCNVKMLRYGWGPNYAAYRCYGCGLNMKTDKETGQLVITEKE